MQKSFLYNNTKINYHIEGNGRTVLLLHGFGEDSNVWHNQIKFLQEHCQLIVPDIPGSGLSERLSDKKEIAIEDYAECMYALLQYEKVQKCILLGHSMGGYITLALVEEHPEIIEAFGFVHSTAYADSEEKKQAREKGIEAIGQYGAYAFLKNTTPNLFAQPFKEKHPDQIKEQIERSKNFSDIALQQYYYAMKQRPDRSRILSESKVPVLFIMGTEDVAVPIKDSLNQCYLPKISYIHTIENVGHMGMLEASDEVNKYLLDFIQSVS